MLITPFSLVRTGVFAIHPEDAVNSVADPAAARGSIYSFGHVRDRHHRNRSSAPPEFPPFQQGVAVMNGRK
jgi:hypothetical protein